MTQGITIQGTSTITRRATADEKRGEVVEVVDKQYGEVVKIYNSLLELIENVRSLPGKDWIYANLDSWKNNPEGTRFSIFHGVIFKI